MAQPRKRKTTHTHGLAALKRGSRVPSGIRKRRKGPIENARQSIQRNGEELLQLVKRGTIQVPSKRVKISKRHTADVTKSPVKEMRDLHEQMKRFVVTLKRTAKEYDALSRKRHNIDMPTWMRWERDGEDLTALNKSTRETAMFLAGRMICPKRCDDKYNATQFGVDADIASLAWEILEAVTPRLGAQTWGSCAGEFFKAFARILRQMQ